VTEADARRQVTAAGRALQRLGLAPGSSGNISVRLEGCILVTPTNSRLGSLEPDSLPLVSFEGTALRGARPSKETPLHLAVYRARPSAQAVVHLHAFDSVAVSCLADLDPADAIPASTAYFLMRIGTVALVPFLPPGSPELAAGVGRAAHDHGAILLANHGSLLAETSLDEAVANVEELEQGARLFMALRGLQVTPIPAAFVRQLRRPAER
jgi:3-dehydro-4-phosphotetronate decarboxylase